VNLKVIKLQVSPGLRRSVRIPMNNLLPRKSFELNADLGARIPWMMNWE